MIVGLIVIVVIGTGAGIASSAGGPAGYACMSISKSGSGVDLTTTGLIHYLNNQYYISCSEGSSLPTGQYKASCLTISPKTVPAAIGSGASTEYYYISASGSAINLVGAPAPTNGTEIITPASVSLQTPC